MTPRMTRTIALVSAFLSVGLLSACSSGGPQPGTAALVGDATIRVSEVNRLTDGFCDAARRDFQSQGNVYPMNVLSSVVLQALTMNSIIDQLADDYGVEPSEAYAQQATDRELSFGTLDPDQAEAALLVQGSALYRDDILTSIGRQQLEEEGVAEPGVDDSLAHGNDLLSQWLVANPPVIDPQYHLSMDTPQASSVDTSTSRAVTTTAVDALLADQIAIRALEDDESERFTTYIRSLPASQRCG